MEHENSHVHQPGQITSPPFWRSRFGVGLIMFGAVAAYFLLTEHRAHFFGALPFLLLLACPLMHVFMHRGHGRHGGEHGANASAEPRIPGTGEKP
jgi:hypothetical protein